ncbi:hypothetical protein MMC25_007831 [Agyrium rufum]|nr:hypothetical protein [Agyrium rufum]
MAGNGAISKVLDSFKSDMSDSVMPTPTPNNAQAPLFQTKKPKSSKSSPAATFSTQSTTDSMGQTPSKSKATPIPIEDTPKGPKPKKKKKKPLNDEDQQDQPPQKKQKTLISDGAEKKASNKGKEPEFIPNSQLPPVPVPGPSGTWGGKPPESEDTVSLAAFLLLLDRVDPLENEVETLRNLIEKNDDNRKSEGSNGQSEGKKGKTGIVKDKPIGEEEDKKTPDNPSKKADQWQTTFQTRYTANLDALRQAGVPDVDLAQYLRSDDVFTVIGTLWHALWNNGRRFSFISPRAIEEALTGKTPSGNESSDESHWGLVVAERLSDHDKSRKTRKGSGKKKASETETATNSQEKPSMLIKLCLIHHWVPDQDTEAGIDSKQRFYEAAERIVRQSGWCHTDENSASTDSTEPKFEHDTPNFLPFNITTSQKEDAELVNVLVNAFTVLLEEQFRKGNTREIAHLIEHGYGSEGLIRAFLQANGVTCKRQRKADCEKRGATIEQSMDSRGLKSLMRKCVSDEQALRQGTEEDVSAELDRLKKDFRVPQLNRTKFRELDNDEEGPERPRSVLSSPDDGKDETAGPQPMTVTTSEKGSESSTASAVMKRHLGQFETLHSRNKADLARYTDALHKKQEDLIASAHTPKAKSDIQTSSRFDMRYVISTRETDDGEILRAIGCVWKTLWDQDIQFAIGTHYMNMSYKHKTNHQLGSATLINGDTFGTKLLKPRPLLLPLTGDIKTFKLIASDEKGYQPDDQDLKLHWILVIADRADATTKTITLNTYDSSWIAKASKDEVFERVKHLVSSHGWVETGKGDDGPKVHIVRDLKYLRRRMSALHQQSEKACGLHVILNAWSYMLGFKLNSKWPSHIGWKALYEIAAEVINCAMHGCADLATIRAFLLGYGLAKEPKDYALNVKWADKTTKYHGDSEVETDVNQIIDSEYINKMVLNQ